MSSRTPKTGLTDRMRDWMSEQPGRFTAMDVCLALEIPRGKPREAVQRAIGDFIGRAEIYPVKRTGRQNPSLPKCYRYNRAWKRAHKGTLNTRICKAMYVVSGTFALSDIQRLTGAKERDYIDKMARQLREDGLIQQVGRRRCAHGAGAEILYGIPNRDRFRLEVME